MPEGRGAHSWDEAYSAGAPAPWDIGRPQPALIRLAGAGALCGTLLDAGCGTGEHTILAARCGADALGIDLSPRAIGIACRKAVERGVTARFEVADVLELGSDVGVFDTIVDSGLFHTFDDTDRTRYVASLHAHLRPGGHLHLMCFSERQDGDWGPRRIGEEELRAAFSSGWHVESLARGRFDVDPGIGAIGAEAWLADVVRLV